MHNRALLSSHSCARPPTPITRPLKARPLNHAMCTCALQSTKSIHTHGRVCTCSSAVGRFCASDRSAELTSCKVWHNALKTDRWSTYAVCRTDTDRQTGNTLQRQRKLKKLQQRHPTTRCCATVGTPGFYIQHARRTPPHISSKETYLSCGATSSRTRRRIEHVKFGHQRAVSQQHTAGIRPAQDGYQLAALAVPMCGGA
jgi:hypothetical protein